MPSSTALKVTIATDWARCRRGVLWSDCLQQLGEMSLDVREYGLADQVDRLTASTGEKLFVEEIQDSQILVVNWDAANGDPDFGADFTLRWFEHRGPEMLSWVDDGGILIIEGQASLGTPTQAAYDAILDPGEVDVCGPENPLRPELQPRRYGHLCRVTSRAQKSDLFKALIAPDLDSRDVTRNYDEMLPGPASRVLTRDLGKLKWNMMYRGWFRWNPLARRRLHWVSIVRTADRRWWKGTFNHTVMLGAQHGRGAIFVTTMFLASSSQTELIACLFGAHGRAQAMPIRRGIAQPVGEFLRGNLIPLLAGLVGAPIIGLVGDWDSSGIFADMTRAVVVVLAFFAFGLLARFLGGLWRLTKEILGW